MFLWAPFLSYIFIIAITPGPNNIMTMNLAAKVGFKKCMPFYFGFLTGFTIVMFLCLLFSSVLYAVVPKIQFPMKIVSAAYMVYLAIITVLPLKSQEIKNNNGNFFIGALLQFINVKIILYGITAISSYILPYYKSLPVLIAFVCLLSFVGGTTTLCWALFGSVFSRLFNKHGKILNIIMAILLLYCAVSLFL
jgi:threonine/homoserine/homoserine lactone efflux protein